MRGPACARIGVRLAPQPHSVQDRYGPASPPSPRLAERRVAPPLLWLQRRNVQPPEHRLRPRRDRDTARYWQHRKKPHHICAWEVSQIQTSQAPAGPAATTLALLIKKCKGEIYPQLLDLLS